MIEIVCIEIAVVGHCTVIAEIAGRVLLRLLSKVVQEEVTAYYVAIVVQFATRDEVATSEVVVDVWGRITWLTLTRAQQASAMP